MLPFLEGLRVMADGDSLRQLFLFRAFIDIGTLSRIRAYVRTRYPPTTEKTPELKIP